MTPATPSLEAAPRGALFTYAFAALLLAVPSAFYWGWTPFLLTRNEFDFFLGMERAWPWLDPAQWFWVGKVAASLLLAAVGASFAYIALKRRTWVASLPMRTLAIGAAGLGVLFGFALPWISPDVFYYIGGGWVDVHYDADIYAHSFREITNPRTDPILVNIAPGFWQLKGNYGPLHHSIAASLVSVSGGSPQLGLIVWKLMNLGIVLGTGAAIARIAASAGINRQFAFFCYACNPLVLFSLVTQAHNDALQNLLIVLAILACVHHRPGLSGLSIGAAIAYKLIGLVLLPLLVIYWWLASANTRWRDVFVCVAAAVIAVAAAFLLIPSSLGYCIALMKDTSWLPPRASIQYLAGLFDGVGLFPPFKPVLSKIIPFIFVLGCVAIALPPLLRRVSLVPVQLARLMFMIFAIWLLTTPTVTEWYVTWLVCLGFLVKDERIERGLIVLSACYLVPVVFIVRAPFEARVIANVILYGLLAYTLIRQIWIRPTPAAKAIPSCPSPAQI